MPYDSNRVYFGIDIGTQNLVIACSNGNYKVIQAMRSKDTVSFFDFVKNAINEIVLFMEDMAQICGCKTHCCNVVGIEHQFDKGKYKYLDRIEHILQYELYIANSHNSIEIYSIHPSQVKKFVTDNGKSDEALFWTKIQSMIHGNIIPDFEHFNNNQHAMEAYIMSLMVKGIYDFPHYKYQAIVCSKLARVV